MNKYLYEGKQGLLSIALKVFCKTPNQSVIESIGSVAELRTKPQRNCNFKYFKTELMLDWNGPTVPKSEPFIKKMVGQALCRKAKLKVQDWIKQVYCEPSFKQSDK